MSRKKLIYFGLLVILLADIGYSFWQHTTQPLDGDMAVIILPSREYSFVMDDPFGMSVLLENEKYVGPNRFFVHYFMHHYFRQVPALLRTIMDPVDAVYVACGLLKILCQFAIAFLIARFIRRTQKVDKTSFVAALVIIMSFFQTNGFYAGMGIIDRSITYVCFYALPTVFLLFFLSPFLEYVYNNTTRRLNWFERILFVPLLLILPFSGPLNIGIILISGFLLGVYFLRDTRENGAQAGIRRFFDRVPTYFYIYLLPLGILCLYSLYIGRNNLENFTHTLPVMERYQRMPIGLGKVLTVKLGTPLLLMGIGVNFILLRRHLAGAFFKHRKILIWCSAFVLLYLLLVPLGGYRNYRKFIIRYDVFIPVTLVLIYLFVSTSLTLWHELELSVKRRFSTYVAAMALVFFAADRPRTEAYKCQHSALEKIANATEDPVVLDHPCTVLSWNYRDNALANGYNSQLLELWEITDGYVGYYHER